MQKKSETSIAALGGTFDHFHIGHAHFLEFASKFAESLLIGITCQNIANEKELSSLIQPFEQRKAAVKNFCIERGIRCELLELSDAFGPTLGQRELECLVVTQLTQEGGRLINQQRVKIGLNPLSVYVADMVYDSKGELISSTRIRAGQIDEQGKRYWDVFASDLVLSQTQKSALRDPLGQVVLKPGRNSGFIAVVGDSCLEEFIKNGWQYQLGVYDLKKRRLLYPSGVLHTLVPDLEVLNPAGMIRVEMSSGLQMSIKKILDHAPSCFLHVFVSGEEDLAAAALVLLLPLESRIYYGQPELGMIEVIVSAKKKQEVATVFSSGRKQTNTL